jgi:hypothetical protein
MRIIGQRHHLSSSGNQTKFSNARTENISHMSLMPNPDAALVKASRSLWVN